MLKPDLSGLIDKKFLWLWALIAVNVAIKLEYICHK